MERLTKRLSSGALTYNYPASWYFDDDSGPDKIAQSAFRQRCVERLAAYEETGLTPELCAEFARADAEGRYIVMRDAEQEGVASLREISEADKDGRCVVLPCKVGDVVYGFHGEKTILPMVAKWIETNTDGWCIAVQYTPMAPRFYRFSDFGKTVFLTREEAKKALQEMEGK